MSNDKKFNPIVADIAREKIGEFVKERRKERAMSQQQLADMASIRKATLIDLEAGRNVTLNTIIAVVACLRGEIQVIWKDPLSVPGFNSPSMN